MPDTGGDVLCPTCGQWTPPAPFCSECGATLRVGFSEPEDAGGGAFRRGHEVNQPGSPWGPSGERFEPEPEDEAARAATAAAGAAAAGAASAARVDHLAEVEPPLPPVDTPTAAPQSQGSEPDASRTPDASRRGRAKSADVAVAAVAAAAVGSAAGSPPPSTPETPAPAETPAAVAKPPPAAPSEPPPAAPAEPPAPPPGSPPVTYAGPPRDGDDDSSGVTGLVFVVFLGIGVLALLGGAILGGVFDGPVADASPTPTIAASTPTPEPLPSLTPDPSGPPSAPGPTPAVTPPPAADGFLARVEPCAEPPTSPSCDNSGAENNGDVWILVSFRHAQATDVIAASIHDESGALVEESRPVALAFCGTSTDCAGWTFLEFHNLDDGDYEARVSRNGSQVATTEFTVN